LFCYLCAKYQFTLFELWSLTYTMHLQLRIIRLQYSTERISAATGHTLTIQRALYCKLGANKAHNLQLTQCELWSRTYTIYLHLRIFRLQYPIDRICDAIWDISTIQCALYCIHGTKYSAHPQDYALWTVVPAIYNVFTAPHIQDSIFSWMYLR
jgi:hypothetical protein